MNPRRLNGSCRRRCQPVPKPSQLRSVAAHGGRTYKIRAVFMVFDEAGIMDRHSKKTDYALHRMPCHVWEARTLAAEKVRHEHVPKTHLKLIKPQMENMVRARSRKCYVLSCSVQLPRLKQGRCSRVNHWISQFLVGPCRNPRCLGALIPCRMQIDWAAVWDLGRTS